MRVCLMANTSWYLFNFRASTIRRLVELGHEIYVISPKDRYSKHLVDLGCILHHLDFSVEGMNLVFEARTVISTSSILRKIKPDVLLTFTPKANIYGGLAAGFLGISYITNISGVGSKFYANILLRLILQIMYFFALKNSRHVFFQNSEDLDTFVSRKLISRNKCSLIMGSGVDIDQFSYVPGQRFTPMVFLFVGRLILEKGLTLLVEAAQVVRHTTALDFQIRVVGKLAPDRTNSISLTDLKIWEEMGLIDFIGETDNVAEELHKCDCLILPTFYGEGMPKSILEAASCGKPVITTKIAGCREAVIDRNTGFLCEPRDIDSLVECIIRFCEMTESQYQDMAREARCRAEQEFSDEANISAYLLEMEKIQVVNPY